MVLKQANELTRWRVAEYEKSQEEAVRHTIREEYGPTIPASNPTTTRFDTPALHHPSEGGAGWVDLRGEGQTPEGPSWWGQVEGPWDN